MKELINFPGETECLRDSGTGGLFVMMVVPLPEDADTECFVDVSILVTRPDVCVSPDGGDVWASTHAFSDSWTVQMELNKHLQEIGKIDWKRWMLYAYSGDELSVPMQAAIHLGSTGLSLCDEHGRGYWTATKDDLTPPGKALYEALEAAYGVSPLLLTFLDT